jgi:integrase
MRGSVIKRGQKWAILFDLGRDPVTGKRVRKWHSGFLTKKAAEKEQIKLAAELDNGSYIEPNKQTVGTFLLMWLDSYARPNVSALTYQRYAQIVKGRLLRDLGAIPLAKLKPQHLITAYARWAQETTSRNKPLSAQSIKHHHRVLSEALSRAVKWQALSVNPALAVDAPRVERAPLHVLDAAQARALLGAATEDTTPYGAAAALALLTGLRMGEVLGLHWADVDLAHGHIRVRQTLQQQRGKGLVMGSPKTHRSARAVSLPPQATQVLLARQDRQAFERQAAREDWVEQGLVLTSDTGGPTSPVSVRRHYYALLKVAGLPQVRFHDLRHTHATLMLANGEHPKIVSERLGHSKINITLDTYSHVLPGLQEQAAERFGALFESAPKAHSEAL